MSNPYNSPQYGQQSNGQTQQNPYAEQPGQQPYGQTNYGHSAYGQSGYNQTGYAYAVANPNLVQSSAGQWVDVGQMRSNATIAMVLGILGVVGILPLIGSLIAWIWGASLQRQAAEAGIPEDTVSSAKVAKILGIIGTSLVIAGFVVGIGVLVLFFWSAAAMSSAPAPLSIFAL